MSMRMSRTSTALAAAAIGALLALSACTSKNSDTGSGGGAATPGAAKTYNVAFVPKLQGIPYFEAMNTGGKKAAAALGNVKWLYQGPTQADAAAQTQIVRSYIQQGVDVLVVAPNDPNSMAPVLKE